MGNVVVYFRQHDAPSLDGSDFGGKGRQACGDQIGIDEYRALGFCRQKLAREGGFTGSVGLYAVSCGMRQSQRATAWVNG